MRRLATGSAAQSHTHTSATLGAATALHLADEIGSLEPGRVADVCVWDWAADPVAERRLSVARSLHEKAFAWMTMADDRNLVATFVAGVARFTRAGVTTPLA